MDNRIAVFPSFHIGKVIGIPIKVHITLLVLFPFFVLRITEVSEALTLFWSFLSVIGLFASITLHELGHAYVAIRKRLRVRQILLLPIGGIAQLEGMPIQPKDEFQIAIAGPAVSFVLALGAYLLANGAFMLGFPDAPVLFLLVLSTTNAALALFNLIPSFPMDGGRIFRAWMTPRVGRLEATRIASKIGRIIAIGFGLIALFQFNFILGAIALFIYYTAQSEYRTVRAQETYTPYTSSPFHTTRFSKEDNDEVTVSPPPYERKDNEPRSKKATRIRRNLFNDLFGGR